MKDRLRKIAGIFARTWVWTLLLVLLAALLVWFAGPYLAVADNKFWEPAESRLLTISALFLFWGLSLVFMSWRASQRKRAEASDEQLQQQQLQQEIITEEQGVLRQRYRDAVRTLRRTSLYRGRSERWRNELPWYLLLGPEGAGKTSMLDFSGIEFPLNRDQQRLTRDIGGTRYCDWYFADHAVLLDTTGRYLTQQESQVDRTAWQTLLGLLRQRRPRALNGVLLVLPVETFISRSELELESLARQTRQRLHEVHDRLGLDVPVYLVLSKADTLRGFDEFFDQLSREESEQVLGASFRPEQDAVDAGTVRKEFEALLQRLNSQVISRMHQERDVQRRGRILDFPHQLAQLGASLPLFIELAFAGNRYQRASRLRGFYLTSAPSIAQNLDPSTAGIGRQLGLQQGMLPSYQSGRARFIRQLMSGVIFPESELAGLDQREMQRIGWQQRALYAGAFSLVLGLGIVWAVSFDRNHDRLQELNTRWHELQAQLAEPAQPEAATRLPVLDQAHAAGAVFPASGSEALWRRAGLDQSATVEPSLQASYHRMLVSELLPRVGAQLEAQIRSSRKDRDILLNSLRAYLMLNLQQHMDPAFLREWLAADWSQRYPGQSATQQSLNQHFARLLELGFSPLALDEQLVANARSILRSESMASVAYRELRARAGDMQPISLTPAEEGFTADKVLIPGLYTQRGYQQVFITQGGELLRELLQDNWVLGEEQELSLADMRRLMSEVEALYFRDYATHWSNAVNRIALQPVLEAEQGASLLARLGGTDSPLTAVLRTVRDNTRFRSLADTAVPEAVTTVADSKVGKLAAAAASQARQSLAAQLPGAARDAVEKRFAPLHRLLDDDGVPSGDLAQAMLGLNALQQTLYRVSYGASPAQSAFELARARMRGQGGDIGQLRFTAQRLPQPVGEWFDLMARQSWNLLLKQSLTYLNSRYQNELYPFYQTALARRYPFDSASRSEVALADFREFFRHQGLAQKFYEDYLQPFVSFERGVYRLRRVDDMVLPLSPLFLEQLNRSQTIQRSFFAENPGEPGVRFRLEPHTLDQSLGRASFRMAGELLEYRHGPIVQQDFRWPVAEGESRVSLTLENLAGQKVSQQQMDGAWSLFRLLDVLKVEHFKGRDVLMLRAEMQGVRASYLLHSQRSPNPFDLAQLRQFSLPAQL